MWLSHSPCLWALVCAVLSVLPVSLRHCLTNCAILTVLTELTIVIIQTIKMCFHSSQQTIVAIMMSFCTSLVSLASLAPKTRAASKRLISESSPANCRSTQSQQWWQSSRRRYCFHEIDSTSDRRLHALHLLWGICESAAILLQSSRLDAIRTVDTDGEILTKFKQHFQQRNAKLLSPLALSALSGTVCALVWDNRRDYQRSNN